MGNATPAAVLSLEDQPDIPVEATPSDHTVADEHGALVSQADSIVAQVTRFASCESFMAFAKCRSCTSSRGPKCLCGSGQFVLKGGVRALGVLVLRDAGDSVY